VQHEKIFARFFILQNGKRKRPLYTPRPPKKPNIALAINLGKKKRGGGGEAVSDLLGRLIANLFNNYRQLLLNPYLDACLLLQQQ
jgi:hypothetical protein